MEYDVERGSFGAWIRRNRLPLVLVAILVVFVVLIVAFGGSSVTLASVNVL